MLFKRMDNIIALMLALVGILMEPDAVTRGVVVKAKNFLTLYKFLNEIESAGTVSLVVKLLAI